MARSTVSAGDHALEGLRRQLAYPEIERFRQESVNLFSPYFYGAGMVSKTTFPDWKAEAGNEKIPWNVRVMERSPYERWGLDGPVVAPRVDPVPSPEDVSVTHDDLQELLEGRLITHFTAAEICPRALPPASIWTNIIPTLRYAEVLRREFGPCTVHSGYRDPVHNKAVGGAKRSLHVAFNALDLSFRDGDPSEWADIALLDGLNQFGGVGCYPTFVHIDTRYLVFGRPPTSWEE
ncbi:MAG TPA: D-Ala-D-Ala carboxypeptidase family metallohydrolase [bacterium]|nr:D-Ala-D-Ala carboxypeptidase family metallohydrolase [bacterium]